MDANAAGQLALQLMMGVSLAACAGLRTWLPLLCVGLLAKFSHIPLNDNFAFITRTDLLTVLGVATLIEVLGDKIIAVDHVLDTIGTFARPIAGALVAVSLISQNDPLWSTVLGIILGGGTALTVHAAKAINRAQATATAPVHAGTGNMALSFGEDFLSLGGIGLAIWIPVIAFILVALALFLCVYLIRLGLHHGKRLLQSLGLR